MKFISLFSGIGGLDLGLERAGMECVAQVEIDAWCQKVLTHRWPNVLKFSDIRDCGDNLPPADLFCGGFPCQPVSLASSNKRIGVLDDRWLWPEFYRVICLFRPKYILVENTPGLLSLGWHDVFRDLARSGYDAEWQTISAAAIGAPHLRKRIYIVAYSKRPSRGSIFKKSLSRISYWGTPNESARSGIPRIWDKEIEQSICDSIELAYGFPQSVGTRLFGNAVVPQVAEFVGRCIMEADTP